MSARKGGFDPARFLFGGFFAAVGFLTVLPVPRRFASDVSLFRRVPVWMPAVGALVGAIASSLAFVVHSFPNARGLAAVVAVAALALVPGGIHLDGLADTCDGFFSCRSRERTLEIMKDSRIGTFGALAIFFLLALELTAVLSTPPERVFRLLFLAPFLGRSAMAPTMLCLASARPGGMGEMCSGPRLGLSAFVSFLGVALVPQASFPGFPGAVLSVTAFVVWFEACAFSRSRIGGYTGDTLGATSELVEAAVLAAGACF